MPHVARGPDFVQAWTLTACSQRYKETHIETEADRVREKQKETERKRCRNVKESMRLRKPVR